MTSLRIVAMCMLVVAGSGCEKRSAFCNDNPDAPGCGGGGDDDSSGCGSCSAAKPFCANDECVQCLQSTDCGGTSPVCDENVCTACASHADCPMSNACLPTGACGDDSTVAYVDQLHGIDGGNAMCNLATPCLTIQHAIASMKPFVKLSGLLLEPISTDKAVTFIADPGTRIGGLAAGAVVAVTGGNPDVEFYDVAIGGVAGMVIVGACVSMTSMNGTVALNRSELAFCTNGGVEATGGNIRIAQSSIHENDQGGINLTMNVKTFDITNTYVFRNGNTSSATVGGASLLAADGAHSRFDFNTVVDNNIGLSSKAAGVDCDFTFRTKNNIIVHNAVNGDASGAGANRFGVCTGDSDAVATSIATFMFKSPDAAPFDYALGSQSSAAVDMGMAASEVVIDVHGTTRPKMTAKDQGAFEFDPAHP